MDKKAARQRRARRTRATIKRLRTHTLRVHRSLNNIYAQVLDPNGKVLTSASTLQANFKTQHTYGGNIEAAKLIGKMIAENCHTIGVTQVAFDRSGFKYHGRVKALAEAAREHGLKI